MPIIWHPCIPNEAQDKLYGKNFRVCYRTEKNGTYRCTVCDKEVTKGSGAAPKTEEKKK